VLVVAVAMTMLATLVLAVLLLRRLGVLHTRLGRLGLLALAGVGRGDRAEMLRAFAVRIHDAEIMLRVLVQVLGRNPVARRSGFPGKRHVSLEHLRGVSADLEAWAVAVEGLGTMWGTRTSAAVVTAAAATASSATIHVAGIVVTAAA
jgi:hypothetical protein